MSKFNKLQVGEVLSETQFYTVDKVSGNKVQLINDEGQSIIVDDLYVDKCLDSSVQFDKTEKITRTELTEIVVGSARIAMTVNFNKKVDVKDVKAALHALYPNKGGIVSQAQFKKNVNKAVDLKGEERTMTGRHYGTTDSTGRLQFIDMKAVRKVGAAYDSRQRLVDPRTLNWAIINGIKYEVK